MAAARDHSLDCHFYDGKLGGHLRDHIDHILDEMFSRSSSSASTELMQPQPALRWFMDQKQMSDAARRMLRIIDTDRSGNRVMVDGEEWDVLDLFPPLKVICEQHPDLFRVLNDQLEDMLNGQCPQGRLYRLIQLFLW